MRRNGGGAIFTPSPVTERDAQPRSTPTALPLGSGCSHATATRKTATYRPVQSLVMMTLLCPADRGRGRLLQEAKDDIASLTRAGTVDISTTAVNLPRHPSAVGGELQILLPVSGLVGVDVLGDRLQKGLGKVEKEITILSKRLSTPRFPDQAPQDVVGKVRSNPKEAQQHHHLASSRLASLG